MTPQHPVTNQAAEKEESWHATNERAISPIVLRLAALVLISASMFIWWIGHPSFVIDMVGDGPAALLRRQSEGYVMIALIVGFWAWLAPSGLPSARDVSLKRERVTSPLAWWSWFVALIIATVLFSTWEALPNFLVTLKEATVAVIIVTAYLGWTRGFGPGRQTWSGGASVRGVTLRSGYYVAVVTVILVTYFLPVDEALGEGFALWLRENSEAFGAILLIPLYFDVVARRMTKTSRLAWYGGVVGLLILAQVPWYPDVIAGFGTWLNEMTEAFIAALVVAMFFDALAIVTNRSFFKM